MKPEINKACVINKNGQVIQVAHVAVVSFCQPLAVSEKDRDDRPHTPIIRSARLIILFCAEERNNAPPARIRATPQATVPAGLPRNADAIASADMPMIQ